MKSKKKVIIIEQPRQIIETDLTFVTLQQNDLKSLLGGKCGDGTGCNCYVPQAAGNCPNNTSMPSVNG